MRTGKKTGAFTPIGIDIRCSAVYGVQFERDGKSLRLHAAASEPVEASDNGKPDPASVLGALTALGSTHLFKGRAVVASVPGGEVEIRRVVLPEGVVAERSARTREAVAMEARPMLIYRPEEAAIDFVPLDAELLDGKRRDAVLMVAARREDVNRHLALLQSARLRCAHLDIGPFAAARVVGSPGTVHAAIDVDKHNTVISVAQGNRVLFGRSIRFGWHHFVLAAARKLNVDESDAVKILMRFGFDARATGQVDLRCVLETGMLPGSAIPSAVYEACKTAFDEFAGEIRRTIDYFSMHYRGSKIQRVFLIGPLLPPNSDALLGQRLGLPAGRGRAFKNEGKVPIENQADSSAFVVAAGLALRGDES